MLADEIPVKGIMELTPCIIFVIKLTALFAILLPEHVLFVSQLIPVEFVSKQSAVFFQGCPRRSSIRSVEALLTPQIVVAAAS